MRLSREELLVKYPNWNENKHDIVKVFYGDEPLVHYDEIEHINHLSWVEKGLGNLSAIDDYIYTQNGEYNKYNTLIGNIYIDRNDKVLCGDIIVKYFGKDYHIIYNRMYGYNSLDILRFSHKVKGFSNFNGQGSPSNTNNTLELESDIINKILNLPLDDYGLSVQEFMKSCRELYNSDKTNYIMRKCFNL